MDNSLFDSQALLDKADKTKRHDDAPPWLAEALALLAREGEVFPREEDAERFVIEYVYPH